MSRILVTGGLGKITKHLLPLLEEGNAQLTLASRSTPPADADIKHEFVKFDWKDSSNHAQILDKGFDKIWLVYPETVNSIGTLGPFLDLAISKGVKRVVFLGLSPVDDSMPGAGEISKYLQHSGIDFAVLRPTWFMQNFTEQRAYAEIKQFGKFWSGSQGRKVPFVSADDVAAVAAKALLNEKSFNSEIIIRGPDFLTYDQLAEIISAVAGRKIEHVDLKAEEFRAHALSLGLPQQVADFLVWMDNGVAAGSEENLEDRVEEITGRPPKSFKQFADENKHLWQ